MTGFVGRLEAGPIIHGHLLAPHQPPTVNLACANAWGDGRCDDVTIGDGGWSVSLTWMHWPAISFMWIWR